MSYKGDTLDWVLHCLKQYAKQFISYLGFMSIDQFIFYNYDESYDKMPSQTKTNTQNFYNLNSLNPMSQNYLLCLPVLSDE